jgi:hypothetical protein
MNILRTETTTELQFPISIIFIIIVVVHLLFLLFSLYNLKIDVINADWRKYNNHIHFNCLKSLFCRRYLLVIN